MGQKKIKPRRLTKVDAWAGEESLLDGGRLKVRVRCVFSCPREMEAMPEL